MSSRSHPPRSPKVRLLTLACACVIGLSVALAGCGGDPDPSPSEQRTEARSPTVTATATARATRTPKPARKPAKTAEPSKTPASSPEPRETPEARRPEPTPTAEAPAARPRGLTHVQVIKRGDAVCRDYARGLAELTVPDSDETRAEYYGEAAELAEKAVTRLERLRVPQSGRRTFKAYVSLLRRNLELVEQLEQAVRDGDAELEQELGREATVYAKRAARLARRYGFETCGGDAS